MSVNNKNNIEHIERDKAGNALKNALGQEVYEKVVNNPFGSNVSSFLLSVVRGTNITEKETLQQENTNKATHASKIGKNGLFNKFSEDLGNIVDNDDFCQHR